MSYPIGYKPRARWTYAATRGEQFWHAVRLLVFGFVVGYCVRWFT